MSRTARRFDAVLAAGVLEHVPFDYESLKEINRVLQPSGRLIITFLPNRLSYQEWRLRHQGSAIYHRRRHSVWSLPRLLRHAGLEPLTVRYQTQLDALPSDAPLDVKRASMRRLGLRHLTSCLCSVAEKVEAFG